MKQLFLILLTILISIHISVAQTAKYYVNGIEVKKEVLQNIPSTSIKSMNTSVENGLPTFKIELNEGAAFPDTVNVDRNVIYDKTKLDESTAKIIEEQYRSTTILKIGDTAADFEINKYAGYRSSLGTLRGKVVLLCFWATWCGPCLSELAPDALPSKVLKNFDNNPDFIFLPVAYTDTKESLDKFFNNDKGSNYSYLKSITTIDPDKSIFALYETTGVPRSFVINKKGVITVGTLGNTEINLSVLNDAINAALGEN